MRLSLLRLSLALAPLVLPAQSDPPVLTCTVPAGISSAAVVQMDLDKLDAVTPEDLVQPDNWKLSTILHEYFFGTGSVATSTDASGYYFIRLTPNQPVDYTAGSALVRFTSLHGNLEATCKPPKIEGHSRVPVLVEDAKDADITITGALQAAVGDTPQYSYSIDGKYDVFSTNSHAIAATFKAVASQQHNADPDSMKLAANYRWLMNLPRRWGAIVNSDLVSYEFEREIKQDKPVALDKPIPKFIEKNSNRVHSAQITFIRSTVSVRGTPP